MIWALLAGCRPHVDRGAPEARVVVALHGLGQRPEDAMAWVEACDLPVRVLAPAAPAPYHGGGSWFDVRFHAEGISFDPAALGDAARELDTWLERTAPAAPLTVTGFSQGGVLSYALAALFPDRIGLAVPMAGALPPAFPLELPPAGPPVRAVHGGVDPIVPVAAGRAAVARLTDAGWDATLTVDPDAGHQVSATMQAAVCAALAEGPDD